ncbi:uridine-cytidine kinase-like 1 [Limosa lapponica baueri]|uniref:uridine/cytidine kinase n=1 Tax=Limosa lapponica baueri TaxID=1758121 RepID=A0A2I0TGL8_LIMLA|nr:uridine-cytidine kinase-like 1 [Limosa lapponica baueri]
MSSPPAFSSVRISGCWALGPDGSNSSAESLDRLYPAVGSTKPPRKRTTSQCKSEPPLLRTSKRTIYTAGRPPWYNEHGTQSKEAFVIGLGGGSASGKTTVATMIIEALDVPWVVLLSMDSFYKSCTVQTPQGQDYEGRTYSGKQITGVSILRAGETMEPALRAVCKDVRIGTILIQTNCNTGEPELHYLRLPKDISEDHVILMDCTVSTGAAAMMAVRVLLDHDVPEDKIFLLSLLMAEMGVHSVAYAFPRVKIITTAVDKKVNDLFRIIPGIGGEAGLRHLERTCAHLVP